MIKHPRALVSALALVVAVGAAQAAVPGNAAASTAAESATSVDHARLQALLHRLTTVDGAPGALAEVRDRRRSTVLTSGVGNVKSQAPVHRDSRFRIGSMTKMFTATALLSSWESVASASTRRSSGTCPASCADTATTGG